MIAALPADEVERLRVLRSLELLDTPPESAFDALVHEASAIAGTEMAAVSLIDADRQWFKACLGLDGTETSREDAFCAHAILSDGVLCVDETRDSPLFADNPYVTGDPGIRAYAGAPISVSGQNVGTVCAFSSRPRPWSPEVKAALASLAAGAAQMLEMRRQLAFKNRLLLSISDGVLATDGDGRVTFWSPAAEAILGWRGTLTLELNNLTRVPIKLYPGLLIAQLSFMTLDRAAERPYGSSELGSHYQGQVAATESRYAERRIG